MRNLIIVVLLIFASCGIGDSNNQKINSNGLIVELRDAQLRNLIRDYINDTGIDAKSTYVMIEIYSIGNREIIYLSHDKELYFEVSGYPTFLSSLDGHLIFVYTSATSYVNTNIYDAIKKYTEEFGITYSHKEGFTYDPPVWKLTRCTTDSFFVDKSAPTLQRDFVPCGFQFDSYNNKLDTMIMK